jgi:hypothetical protein
MSFELLSNMHMVPAVIPVADAFAGGAVTEAVSLRDYSRAALIIQTGAVEDAGISNVVTLQACTSAAGAGATAMAFRRRTCLYSTTVDTWGALTDVTSAGYNFAVNNAVANVCWYIDVTAEEIEAALPGATFIRAAIAETANKTITASGLWVLYGSRYPQGVPATAIA